MVLMMLAGHGIWSKYAHFGKCGPSEAKIQWYDRTKSQYTYNPHWILYRSLPLWVCQIHEVKATVTYFATQV